MSLTANSSDKERNEARQRLVSGEIRFIFVVDLYNEGVDIPEIDTILFLRALPSRSRFSYSSSAAVCVSRKEKNA